MTSVGKKKEYMALLPISVLRFRHSFLFITKQLIIAKFEKNIIKTTILSYEKQFLIYIYVSKVLFLVFV